MIGWRQTLTTSPANHIRFLLVRANKFAKWKTGFSDGRRRNFSVVRETEGNPSHREASDCEDDLGGGQASRNDIVQAIVADRSLITALTSAILSNMDHQLKNTKSESSNSALSSQNQPINPGVSDDQTGTLSKQVNPGVSFDQTGTENHRRAAEGSADSENYLHVKKPRGPNTLD